jgi:hypothetical protein
VSSVLSPRALAEYGLLRDLSACRNDPTDVLRCPKSRFMNDIIKRGEERVYGSEPAGCTRLLAGSPSNSLSPQVGILAFPSVMYMTLPRQLEALYLPRSIFLNLGVSDLGAPRYLKWKWPVSIIRRAHQFAYRI